MRNFNIEELKAITKSAKEARARHEQTQVEQFLQKIYPQLLEDAQDGRDWKEVYNITVPRSLLTEALKELGFIVYNKPNSVIISWGADIMDIMVNDICKPECPFGGTNNEKFFKNLC